MQSFRRGLSAALCVLAFATPTLSQAPAGAGATVVQPPKAEPQQEQQPAGDAALPAPVQAMLLEASDSGSSGAVPFNGTFTWSRTTDETGLLAITGRGTIPGRNLSIDLLLRDNVDPALPADLMAEVNFGTRNDFVGGSIATLPGILLKDAELTTGRALIGASAKVVGNQFLLALSNGAADIDSNRELLRNKRWIDIAITYETGRRAVITIERDDETLALFREAIATWSVN